jgi:hypothetical protein
MSAKVTATDIFLAILAIMLIGVSFYQTWLGLQQIFGPSSFAIALTLSLLLLFLLWQLRMAKVRRKSTNGLVGVYFFFASFCFVANFNALYTRFMRTDIYTSELRNINEKFNNLETDIESKLHYLFDPKLAADIENEKKQLMRQIINEGEPGIGTKAKIIIARIEKMTGKKVTELKVIGNDYESLARQMGEQIDDMIGQLSPDERILKSDVENAVLKWNKDIQSLLLQSQKDIDDMAQGQIDKALTEYNKLGNRAHTVLGEDKFKFVPEQSKTQEVGKIGYAFNHAISNFGIYQLVVLAGCILLDFGIMIIILLMPTSNDKGDNSNGSVFINKRSGKTLIPNN